MAALSRFTHDSDDDGYSMEVTNQRLTRQRRPSEKQQQHIEEQEESERRRAAQKKGSAHSRRVVTDDKDEEDKDKFGSDGSESVGAPSAWPRGGNENTGPLDALRAETFRARTGIESDTHGLVPRCARLKDSILCDEREVNELDGSCRTSTCGARPYDDEDSESNHEVRKCCHSVNTDSDEGENAGIPKAQCTNQGSGRPTQKDFNDDTQEVLHHAIKLFRCKISARDAFPNHATESDWAKESWEEAQQITNMCIPLTITLVGMTKACLIVETMYGFSSGQNKRIVEGNRTLAMSLKDKSGFVYKFPSASKSQRKGLYKHEIIVKLVNNVWFANRHDEGVVYHQYFHPLPAPAIALLLTVIECCIDEWGSGVKTDINFMAVEYKRVYDTHLESLVNFGQHTSHYNLLNKLCNKLAVDGRFFSGAEPINTTIAAAVPPSAFNAAIQEYEEDLTESDSDGEELFCVGAGNGQGQEIADKDAHEDAGDDDDE
ncbi:hypothetical protein JAAARDRAFT_711578 [Jaapia argillacea MUCL 33604]|uniref:DUF6532 domain-containing protein n=1 Tax=Jaapia argillacea MUCL 33604 TaxID=933084 RepID=A0A067Q947_9AGAM|nr:hypothetical protein JAAARDRAFT_711578 [Jaapia argillacea MUCL 33604]